ncbi:hypothetical protein [Paenibacillus mendelii]|uniref:Mandelate racemase/muconate lactonizing enzyme N-terminal domain-containing protein n=1 Tax=Paenibacillus mendelii TaxID=206163 RepID=A0ABV6JD47_9BACL|nr:hypothetical protein [Paenibacillus mendelii]MCQ6562415.1 hypothetical protein [Paenibacillus mendelii]
MNNRLCGIELFQFDIQLCEHEERGVLEDCRYGLLKLTCGGQTGWGEGIMSVGDPHFDFMHWASFLYTLRRMPITEALTMLSHRQLSWEASQIELTSLTLSDLRSRLQSKMLMGTAQFGASFPVAIGSGILPASSHSYDHGNHPAGGYESSSVQAQPTVLGTQLGVRYGTGSGQDVDRLFRISRAYFAVL